MPFTTVLQMRRGLRRLLPPAIVAAALVAPAPAAAQTPTSCAEPTAAGWVRLAPERLGFDAAKLQDAIDYGTSANGFSIRVYRNGCLVGVDRAYALNRDNRFESWSLAKSIVSLVFGRAMTLGLISPDDPVGALLPEADKPHGAITMRDLLTMTSGLRWNGFRDYDIAMPDRLRDALTVGIAHPPGTWFEYSQSGPALLAEAIQRAVGEDFQSFAQRELFGPIGITPGTWHWARDSKGHTQGFFGLNMRTDDFARLGELMRRGGVWGGRRLLARSYVRDAITPSKTNGCYGWLIWVNAARPCIGPTISERPVRDRRYLPEMPTDTYHYEGLFGQIVTVMPSLGIVVARNGQDSNAGLTGGTNAEQSLYLKVLKALTDGSAPKLDDGSTVPGDAGQENPDAGFQHAFTEPQEYTAPWLPQALPPAGPRRARALRLRLAHNRAGRGGKLAVRVTCPARSDADCAGPVTVRGATASRELKLARGATTVLRFRLRHPPSRKPRTLVIRGVNRDEGGDTPTSVEAVLHPRKKR